jgi:hypothetical protein
VLPRSLYALSRNVRKTGASKAYLYPGRTICFLRADRRSDHTFIFRTLLIKLDPFATGWRHKRLPPPTSLSGQKPKLVLGTWITIDGKRKVCFPSNPILEIGTQECKDMEVYLQPNIGLDFKGISPYLVDPNTLPSTAQLDEWARQLIPLYFNLAPHLTNFIDEFLLRFLAISPSLPIVSFSYPL